jgi:hypothetical protein
MRVDIEIPEEDVAYVREGMQIAIRLNTYRRDEFDARVLRIVPRAETRENRMVFLAEAELDNPEETLRPGMRGRATLEGERRSLAWLLFHKPYESLLMALGW